MLQRLRLALLATLVACGPLAPPTFAQAPAASEQALKAVLFYKLALFTYRERYGSDAPVLCTLGRTQLDEALRSLVETQAEGLPGRFRALRSPSEADDCAFIFVGRSETGRIDQLLVELARPGLVTVSDIPGFARAGGMVELGVKGRGAGLSIVINRGAARAAGVEFMAQLLRLAEMSDD